MLDFILPKTCFSCGTLGVNCCWQCRQKLEFVTKPSCFYCERISDGGGTHESCRRPHGIDGLVPICYYNTVAKELVKGVKYHSSWSAVPELFRLLPVAGFFPVALLVRNCPDLVIQPMPLHWTRENIRGFNQSTLFAKHLSRLTKRPLVDVLVRKRATEQLARTGSRIERIRAIRGAFAVRTHCDVRNKDILLVDDVVTSGSTIREATRTLKRAGARSVFIWCFARD